MKERRPRKRAFSGLRHTLGGTALRARSMWTLIRWSEGPIAGKGLGEARVWPRGGSVCLLHFIVSVFVLFSKWNSRGFSFLKVKFKFLVLDNYNNLVTNHKNFKCFKDLLEFTAFTFPRNLYSSVQHAVHHLLNPTLIDGNPSMPIRARCSKSRS